MSVLIDLTDDDEGGGGGMVPSRFTCVKCSFINMIMFDKIRICEVRQDSDPPHLFFISCTTHRTDLLGKRVFTKNIQLTL